MEGLDQVVGIRIGNDRVLPDDIQGLDFALRDGRHHAGHGQAHPIRQVLDPPGRFHLGPGVGIGYRLITGKDVGQAAHVAGPLDVVLAPEGVDPAAFNPDVAAEHGQVGQGLDVVGADGVLGDAHGIDDGCGLGLAVEPGGAAQVIGGDPADLLHIFRGIFGHGFFEGLEVFRAFGDIGLVVQILLDDEVHQAVDDRDVGAGTLPQPQGGVLHQIDAPGFDNDDGLCYSDAPPAS